MCSPQWTSCAPRAAAGGAIHDPVTSTAIGGGRALVVDVPLAGDGADTASDNALLTLRNQLLPDTFGKIPGVSYPVAGDTARGRGTRRR